MKRYILLLLLTQLSLYVLSQPAVQWQRAIGGSDYDEVFNTESIIQTFDGGYLVVGITTSDDGDIPNLHGYSNALIIKLTATGATEWIKSYGTTTQDGAFMGRQLPDSTYVILGFGGALTEELNGDTIVTNMPWLAKLEPQGDVIWQKYLPTGTYGLQIGFDLTSDGGFILAGYGPHECYEGIAESMQDAALTKLDAEGELEWMRCYGGSKDDLLGLVYQTADGGYIAAGTTQSSDGDVPPNAISVDGWVIKVDESGELEWVQTYGTEHMFTVTNLTPAHDSGYLITAMNVTNNLQTSHRVYKLDELGQVEWEKTYSTSPEEALLSIEKSSDGGYVIVGSLVSGIVGEPGGIGTPSNGWILKIDHNGTVNWEQDLGGSWRDRFSSVVQTTDGGFAVVGELQSLAFDLPQVHGSMDIWVVKFGPLNHTLNGRIHLDVEADCLADDEEEGLAGWLVQARDASGGPANFFALTDSAGYYSVQVDSATYVLSANTSSISPYWETCLLQDTINIVNDTHTVYMPTQILAECPYLTVDISAPFLRRCFDNTYTVHYCNYGTAEAEDAYIEVTLDPFMDFISSTIPYSDSIDNTYQFPIGAIPVGECGSFMLTAYIQCAGTELGQTHCSSAQIYPDSLCLPPDPAWDGSSIEADVTCTGDSILFTITNVGEGNMANQLEYIIIEDQIVLMSGQFQLNSMESSFILLEANGSTVHLQAEQSPEHPFGDGAVGATIEGCGGWISLGFFTQWASHNGYHAFHRDCQENIGSFDPNDKTGFPRGFGEEHIIERGQELEYLIRFQNTGTDTAFTVVIVDSLDLNTLNLATLRPGASSHEYVYSVTPEGKPVFTFNHILLPDSTTNEAASHGFVRFRIQQQPHLLLGTDITNTAFIYFDFNEPIQTNTTVHRIGQLYPWSPVQTGSVQNSMHRVRIIPNPVTDSALIQLDDIQPGALRFLLLNSAGQLVREERNHGTSIELRRGDLPAGIYFFRLEMDGRQLTAGKIMVQ